VIDGVGLQAVESPDRHEGLGELFSMRRLAYAAAITAALAVGLAAGQVISSPIRAQSVPVSYEYKAVTSEKLNLASPGMVTEVEKLNQTDVAEGWELLDARYVNMGSDCEAVTRSNVTQERCSTRQIRYYLLRKPR
jgi:hypothetical protein